MLPIALLALALNPLTLFAGFGEDCEKARELESESIKNCQRFHDELGGFRQQISQFETDLHTRMSGISGQFAEGVSGCSSSFANLSQIFTSASGTLESLLTPIQTAQVNLAGRQAQIVDTLAKLNRERASAFGTERFSRTLQGDARDWLRYVNDHCSNDRALECMQDPLWNNQQPNEGNYCTHVQSRCGNNNMIANLRALVGPNQLPPDITTRPNFPELRARLEAAARAFNELATNHKVELDKLAVSLHAARNNAATFTRAANNLSSAEGCASLGENLAALTTTQAAPPGLVTEQSATRMDPIVSPGDPGYQEPMPPHVANARAARPVPPAAPLIAVTAPPALPGTIAGMSLDTETTCQIRQRELQAQQAQSGNRRLARRGAQQIECSVWDQE